MAADSQARSDKSGRSVEGDSVGVRWEDTYPVPPRLETEAAPAPPGWSGRACDMLALIRASPSGPLTAAALRFKDSVSTVTISSPVAIALRTRGNYGSGRCKCSERTDGLSNPTRGASGDRRQGFHARDDAPANREYTYSGVSSEIDHTKGKIHASQAANAEEFSRHPKRGR